MACFTSEIYESYLLVPEDSAPILLSAHRDCITDFIRIAASSDLPNPPMIPQLAHLSKNLCVSAANVSIALKRNLLKFLTTEKTDFIIAKSKANPKQLAILDRIFEKAGDRIVTSLQVDCRFMAQNPYSNAMTDSPLRTVNSRADIVQILQTEISKYEKKLAGCL